MVSCEAVVEGLRIGHRRVLASRHMVRCAAIIGLKAAVARSGSAGDHDADMLHALIADEAVEGARILGREADTAMRGRRAERT